jgi:hypothetical protein
VREVGKAEAVGLEPTIRHRRTPVFGTGPSSGRMTSVQLRIDLNCGGWNRTSGLQVQSLASLPAATAPHQGNSYRLRPSSSLIARRPLLLYQQQLPRIFWAQVEELSPATKVRGEGFEPSLPASKAGSLPLADPRARLAQVPCRS